MGILILCTHPKPKTNQVLCLSGFRNLNKKLKRKPYPMPNINEMLLKLKVCQYDTPLGLNMGHFHIRISKNASKLCIIIIP